MKNKKSSKGQAYQAMEQRRNAMYAMLSKLNSSRVVPGESVETDYNDCNNDNNYGYCERHDTSWNDCYHDHEYDHDDDREDYDY